MRLKSSDTVCDINAKELRDFLKKNSNGLFSEKFFLRTLKCKKHSFNKLVKEDYLIKHKDSYYATTVKGNALRGAKFIKPITREKAEEIMLGIIERSKEINNNDYYIVNIDKIYAFGSYITNSSDLGDLDLYYLSSFKKGYDKEKSMHIGRERAPASMQLYSAWFFAEEIEPKRYLVNKNKYINFHSKSEVKDSLKAKTKLIWSR